MNNETPKQIPTNSRFIDRTGMKYGRLTVICFSGKFGKHYKWLCKCSCGNEKAIDGSSLSKGSTVSCGCFRNEQVSLSNKKHGLSDNELFAIWYGIKRRCFDERHGSYHNYGGRGITIAEEFLDLKNFCEYVKTTIGERPTKKHSIDRIDNSKGYVPGNIKWSLPSEQSRNKRTNKLVNVNGQLITLIEAAERYDINYHCVIGRLSLGWTIEDALTRPIRKRTTKK